MEKELPKNWIETSLMDIAIVSTGKKDANFASDSGEYPFFTCAYEPIKAATYSFEGNVLILPGNGANVGEVFYYSGKFEAYQRTYIIHNIIIDPKYLFYFFRCYWRRLGVSEQFGSATNYIKIGNFKNFKISFPPRSEQHRIVAKLDKLFRQLEFINKKVDNLKTIKDRFIYSCLVDKKNKQFYSRQKIGSYLEERTERVGENWKVYNKIGVSAKKGIIELSTGQKKSFEKYKVVRPGDFIYNTMRVNIGSIAIYTGKEIAITSPDYVVFKVKNFLSSELLLGFLKSDQGLLEIGANTKGSVRARLYFKSLSEIRMPLSNEKIQILAQKFLTTFSISFKKINEISNKKLKDLEISILNKAFKGELVPQLESDGYARELLREIEKSKANLILSASDRRKKMKDFNERLRKYSDNEEDLNTAAEGASNYKSKI